MAPEPPGMAGRGRRYRRTPATGIAFSILLILLGALFFADNLGWVSVGRLGSLWPVAVIAMGIVRMFEGEGSRQRLRGLFLLLVGVSFLAQTLGWASIGIETLWPLLLIGAGIFALSRSLGSGGAGSAWAGPSEEPPPSRAGRHSIDEVAVFAGVKRKVESRSFRGGEITSAFSGVEIDLRQAEFPAMDRYAEIEFTAAFAGVDLKVPPSWNVVITGTAIFGAYEDKTVPPRPEASPAPVLVISGIVVFGSVTIKN